MLQTIPEAGNTKIKIIMNYAKKTGHRMVGCNPLILMVGPGGFEPPTSTVSR